jgi:hypothetical protein
MSRRARALIALVVALGALALAGCGRDDFENEPRPALSAEVGVKVGDDGVVVSPASFGAGLVNFTIANLTDTEATVEIAGPTQAESEEVVPGGTTILKTEVVTGDYRASVSGPDARPFDFEVGPERESAQNELLLP